MAYTETDLTREQRLQTAGTNGRGVSDMARQLKDDVSTMMRLKLELLKSEVQESVKGYTKDGVTMAIGGVMLFFAAIFLNVALTCLIARLFPFSLPVNYGLGALVVMLLNGAIGGTLIMMVMKRLKTRSIAPKKTLHEIERDKEWITSEIR